LRVIRCIPCGPAFKNKGVQPVLDAVNTYRPSPPDRRSVTGSSFDGETELTGARGRRTVLRSRLQGRDRKHTGTLTYVRVYSGRLESLAEDVIAGAA
jgi:elongation factor G